LTISAVDINKLNVCVNLLLFSFTTQSYAIILCGFIILFSSFFDNVILPSFLHSYQGRSSLSTLVNLVSLYLINAVILFLLIFSVLKMNLSANKQISSIIYHIMITGVLASVVLTLLLIVISVLENKSYAVFTYLLIVTYDLVISSALIMILIFKFSYWLKRRKNFYEFLYTLAFSMFLLSLISANIGVFQELGGRPSPVTPIPDPWDRMTTIKPASFEVYRISFLISFGLVWIATSFFLIDYFTNYSKGIGKWKYWTLVILPLIYFISSTDFVTQNFLNELIFQYPSFTNFIFYFLGSTKQVGGFFFALSFIFMAKNIDNTKIKYYLLFTATGIMILFSSIQISAIHILPYPPFGLITLASMPISSYLVLVGLYYSARSVSNDKKILLELRKEIKNKSYSFLRAIGSAEWNENLQITVHRVLNQLKDKEVTDSNLQDEDIRNYVFDVVEELKKQKNLK